MTCVGTYNDESPYNLFRWLNVGADDLADEVGSHADDGDHGNEREASNKDKGLRQRRGSIFWDRHGGLCIRYCGRLYKNSKCFP